MNASNQTKPNRAVSYTKRREKKLHLLPKEKHFHLNVKSFVSSFLFQTIHMKWNFFFQKMTQKACTTIVRKVKDNFSMIKVIFFYYWFIIILILLLNWIMWTLVVFFLLSVIEWRVPTGQNISTRIHIHTHAPPAHVSFINYWR